MIEPAPPPERAEAVRRIATTAGALLTWQAAERGRAQAELLLALIEAAGEHSDSPGQLLRMVCEQLALRVQMTRASVFLSVDGVLVPRMSRYADGHDDPDGWKSLPRVERAAGDRPGGLRLAAAADRDRSAGPAHERVVV